MRFVALYEKNDHEGETWRFWLQVDANENAIEQLRQLLDPDDKEFTLSDEEVDEEIVDILVEYTMTGYRDFDNKVTGIFTIPPEGLGEWNRGLYKGGIRKYFKTLGA